jgi:hypothetical protein
MIAKTKTMEYEPTPVGKPTKSGIRVISEMSTARILLYITSRHKYGLSLTLNFTFIGFELWDKVVRPLFF